MDFKICLIFINLFSSKIDTIYLSERCFIVNNERSCFTCIKPVSTYLMENQDDFHFINISHDLNSLAVYPNLFKDEKFSSFCKNEVKMLYILNGTVVDSLNFSYLNLNLPLIIIAKNSKFMPFEFENIFGRGNINNHKIRKKFRNILK